MKKFLKKIIKKVILLFPMRNVIFFESVPNLSDNPKAVFDEMLKRRMNDKYKLVWYLYDENSDLPRMKNVHYVSAHNRIRLYYYLNCSKCLIIGNRFVVPQRKNQIVFYLSHGTPLKDPSKYYVLPSTIQYCLSAAPGVDRLYREGLGITSTEIFSLGYPRNDALTKSRVDIKKVLNTSCKKIVVWYPTFRQHVGGMQTKCVHALPIIHDEFSAQIINEWAKEWDVLIVLKPHFAQNLDYVKKLELSNLRFIDDAFFEKNHMGAYEFVGSCDALLSDYSSIYYDFTLCDKPIGLVLEDIEEYKKNPGLIENYEYYMRGGVKIYDVNDLKSFIQDVAQDKDALRDLRNEIKKIVNYSDDGKNSERVLDFIIEKINL